MTWIYDGDRRITGYSVGWHVDDGYREQREAEIVWDDYPVTGCKVMTAVLTGLTPAHYHLFVVMSLVHPETGEDAGTWEIGNQFFGLT